jgi:hypothetical protein
MSVSHSETKMLDLLRLLHLHPEVQHAKREDRTEAQRQAPHPFEPFFVEDLKQQICCEIGQHKSEVDHAVRAECEQHVLLALVDARILGILAGRHAASRIFRSDLRNR